MLCSRELRGGNGEQVEKGPGDKVEGPVDIGGWRVVETDICALGSSAPAVAGRGCRSFQDPCLGWRWRLEGC